jgi:prepilin-type N-terminal cleavage/methylation domain-containing protein
MLGMMKYPDSAPLSVRFRRRERGFTLMEMLVVIALIAVMVVIGYPILWRSRVRANLLGEVRMLQQATAVARINAVKYSRRVAMKILDGNTIQEGGLIVAWVDDNADGLQTAGEPEVGRWLLRNGYFLAPDSGNIFFKLASSGTARGVVFLPNGVTIANAAGSIGVGQGAVEVRDSHLNRIRLMIRGGSGSVIREMWNPEASDWSDQIRFWRY